MSSPEFDQISTKEVAALSRDVSLLVERKASKDKPLETRISIVPTGGEPVIVVKAKGPKKAKLVHATAMKIAHGFLEATCQGHNARWHRAGEVSKDGEILPLQAPPIIFDDPAFVPSKKSEKAPKAEMGYLVFVEPGPDVHESTLNVLKDATADDLEGDLIAAVSYMLDHGEPIVVEARDQAAAQKLSDALSAIGHSCKIEENPNLDK